MKNFNRQAKRQAERAASKPAVSTTINKEYYTKAEAIKMMSNRLPEYHRATWESIWDATLEKLSISGIYADTLFRWKKISENQFKRV